MPTFCNPLILIVFICDCDVQFLWSAITNSPAFRMCICDHSKRGSNERDSQNSQHFNLRQFVTELWAKVGDGVKG
jgi:hypothetical protein